MTSRHVVDYSVGTVPDKLMTLEEARHMLKRGESCDVAEALSWALSQLEWRPIETYVPGPVPDSGWEWDRDPVEVWDGELNVAYWTSTDGWINARDRSYDEAERLRPTHWRPLGPGPEGK